MHRSGQDMEAGVSVVFLMFQLSLDYGKTITWELDEDKSMTNQIRDDKVWNNFLGNVDNEFKKEAEVPYAVVARAIWRWWLNM